MISKRSMGVFLQAVAMIGALGIMWAMLWVFQINAYGGLQNFVQKYSFDGHFMSPPLFGVITLFYKYTLIMIFAMGIVSAFVGWVGDKLIRGME